jgi:hypothetical protein
VSRGEGELLTVPKPRAVSLLSVYLAVKPVGKPDAGNRLVRFDERGWETERCRMAQATAPILDSTKPEVASFDERSLSCRKISGSQNIYCTKSLRDRAYIMVCFFSFFTRCF